MLYAKAPSLILEFVGFLLLSVTIFVMLKIMNSSYSAAFSLIALLAVSSWKILPAVNRVLNGVSAMRGALPFLEKVFEFLGKADFENTADVNKPKILHKVSFSKNIIFRNIQFKYENQNKNQFNDFNLEIKKGEALGIIGHSGAGKSTLVNLLSGILYPSEGGVYIDDTTIIKKHDAKVFRSFIGYVSQEPYFFDGTIAQNVAMRFDQKQIDRDQVWRSCMSAAADFVNDLEDGIDAVIGERGVTISGGQKQRLSIARALYSFPELLILDEATSSLDEKKEAEILNTIYSLKGDMTIIIISHRMATVEKCDRVLWIEKGAAVKLGVPSEIISLYSD